jgi:tRNA (guanine-N(7)-)-methyltransferase subunit TRM82
MAQGDAAAADSAAPASDLGSSAVGKTYTKEEMEGLSSKQLGRMKSQGVDVGDILLRRKKATKNKTSALRQEVQPAEAGGAGEESKVNADQS